MSEENINYNVAKNDSLRIIQESDSDDCSYVSSSDDSEEENRDNIKTQQYNELYSNKAVSVKPLNCMVITEYQSVKIFCHFYD